MVIIRRSILAYAFGATALLALTAFVLPAASAAPPPPPPGPQIDFGKAWVPQGPAPIINGQVENVPSTGAGINDVAGALHAVATHPTDPNIGLVGGVYGGIWRTTNLQANPPTWTRVSPDLGPQSIADIQYDTTDATNNTLVAAIGYMSSFLTGQSTLPGVLRSTDGGLSWTVLGDAVTLGENMIAAAARGATIVSGSNARNNFGAEGFVLGTGRLMRSTSTGTSWTTISGAAGTLLPAGSFPTGPIFDIEGDPNSTSRLYCTVGGNGIFRSNDTGATWRNVSSSDATLNLIITAGSNNNAEMSVSPNGRLWVVVMQNGQAAYIGYSDDADTSNTPTWTQMDFPITMESNGDFEGLNPRSKPGSQGATHLSIVAGSDNTTIYVGGDRQDGPFLPANSLGATEFAGRLFRGDSTVAAVAPGSTVNAGSPQWDHLTHIQNLIFAGGGTANNSAPHADSRSMTFDANGRLIEVDDTGIYVRTSPTDNTGDWFSLNGNLQVTEAHDVAYDTVSDILMSGNQDAGSIFQTATGSMTWTQIPIQFPIIGTSFMKNDGGDVNVDPVNPAGGSTRFFSFQNLSNWTRQTFTGAGAFLAEAQPTLTGAGGGFAAQFKTPVELNAVNPLRVLIGAANDCYESMNQGDNVTGLGTGAANVPGAIAYGAGGNAEALYIGSGSTIWVRMAAGLPVVSATPFPGAFIRDLVMDPANPLTAFIVTVNNVWHTPDGGTTWNDITGDLAAVGGQNSVRTVTYVPNATDDGVLIGTRTGVYGTLVSSLGTWHKVGTALPDVPVWELQYDATDDLLIAGTMGKGIWTTPMLTTPSDITPPTLMCSVARTVLWPPIRGMFPIGLAVNAADNQPPAPQVNITVYSEEPDGAAPYAPDAMGTEPANTRLRAERAYPGNGRVYLVKVEVFDAAGNMTSACKTVVVPVMPTLYHIMMVRAEAAAGQALCLAAAPGVTPAGFNELLCYTAP